jgi:hypothetical protein
LEILKNFNDSVCNGVGNACDGSWFTVVVDAVDEGSVGECDEVVGRKGSRVGVVSKLLHELEWRAMASDSTNGMPWLTSGEHAD